MRNGYLIIDSDRHLIEPPDLWLKWIEARRSLGRVPRERAPQGVRWARPGSLALEVAGRLMVDDIQLMRLIEPLEGRADGRRQGIVHNRVMGEATKRNILWNNAARVFRVGQ
jgi:predicted TIM-barrel fold metal-dependent hydrolase